MVTEAPNLEDITTKDTQSIGKRVKRLSVGDSVKVANNRREEYVIGTVVEKKNRPNDEEVFFAIIEDPDGTRYELHANWRDIMPDADDQETPYTGLIEEPFNDTSPPITDLQIVN
jgi:hypothetical protein